MHDNDDEKQAWHQADEAHEAHHAPTPTVQNVLGELRTDAMRRMRSEAGETVVSDVIFDFVRDANQAAFEQLLVHMYNFRDQLKEFLFMGKRMVFDELIELSDSLKDIQENVMTSGTDPDSSVTGPLSNNTGRSRAGRIDPSDSPAHDVETEMENALLRQHAEHLKNDAVGRTMRVLSEAVEKRFDRFRKKMERTFLDDGNEAEALAADAADDEELSNEEDDIEHEGTRVRQNRRAMTDPAVDLCSLIAEKQGMLTERTVKRVISKTSYLTHNDATPAMSVNLRTAALLHLASICSPAWIVREEVNARKSTDPSEQERVRAGALEALILYVRDMVRKDFECNRYATDTVSIARFRTEQLRRFEAWTYPPLPPLTPEHVVET